MLKGQQSVQGNSQRAICRLRLKSAQVVPEQAAQDSTGADTILVDRSGRPGLVNTVVRNFFTGIKSKARFAQRMHASGESASTIAATMAVSRATAYRVLAESAESSD
jgi:hypothetical protein